MAQRLKVAYALHRPLDGFLIYDISGPEIHLHAEPFQDLAFQDLHLHLAHDLGPDLSQGLIPHDMEQGILLLQKPEIFQHDMDVHPVGEDHLVGEHRLQERTFPRFLRPEALARTGGRGACDRTDAPSLRLIDRLEFRSGVDPDLVDLFRLLLIQKVLYLQASSGDLQMGQPVSLAVPGDLKDPRAEFPGISGPGSEGLKAL